MIVRLKRWRRILARPSCKLGTWQVGGWVWPTRAAHLGLSALEFSCKQVGVGDELSALCRGWGAM